MNLDTSNQCSKAIVELMCVFDGRPQASPQQVIQSAIADIWGVIEGSYDAKFKVNDFSDLSRLKGVINKLKTQQPGWNIKAMNLIDEMISVLDKYGLDHPQSVKSVKNLMQEIKQTKNLKGKGKEAA